MLREQDTEQEAQSDGCYGTKPNNPRVGSDSFDQAEVSRTLFFWDRYDSLWVEKFERLKEYKAKHNHTRVPNYFPDDPQLGNFVKHQKAQYRKNKLPAYRIELLNSIGFDYDTRLSSWMDKCERLKAYKAKYNHTRVGESDPGLGNWVAKQRQLYTKNKLSAERASLLQSIGFEADLSVEQISASEFPELPTPWAAMFARLKDYKEKYRHTSVPSRCTEYPGLARWVANQRNLYKRKKLSEDRILLLESLGFKWSDTSTPISPVARNPPDTLQWLNLFDRLKAYEAKYNHTGVPKCYPDDPQLGIWVASQRALYRKKKLPVERIELLESLGFAWSPHARGWMKSFESLKKYKAKFNHTSVPARVSSLGTWVQVQRRSYRNNQLSAERFELLDSLGFEWEIKKGRPKGSKKQQDNVNTT